MIAHNSYLSPSERRQEDAKLVAILVYTVSSQHETFSPEKNKNKQNATSIWDVISLREKKINVHTKLEGLEREMAETTGCSCR